jgi:putative flippase GtrA
VAGEGTRYLVASAAAFAVDFAAYVALIRLASWHYLLAAPAGFALGLATIYVLAEFALFAAIGLLGMTVNEAVIYAAVEHGRLSFEAAKLASAAVVFTLNFTLRKLLLFTRYGGHPQ